jgi:hypothetical protein
MKNKILILILIFGVVLAALAIIESQTHFIRHTIADVLYDNYSHYLPCTALPTETRVLQTLAEQADTVQAIMAVNPAHVGVEVGHCEGKADLLIWYASHQDRGAIEALLSEDLYFYGIPVRLQNR